MKYYSICVLISFLSLEQNTQEKQVRRVNSHFDIQFQRIWFLVSCLQGRNVMVEGHGRKNPAHSVEAKKLMERKSLRGKGRGPDTAPRWCPCPTQTHPEECFAHLSICQANQVDNQNYHPNQSHNLDKIKQNAFLLNTMLTKWVAAHLPVPANSNTGSTSHPFKVIGQTLINVRVYFV